METTNPTVTGSAMAIAANAMVIIGTDRADPVIVGLSIANVRRHQR